MEGGLYCCKIIAYLSKWYVRFGISMFSKKWWREWCRGKIEGCIIGKEEVQKVAKALKTILRKGYLSRSELLEVFNEVERGSVQLWCDYAERQYRFNELKKKVLKTN